MREIANEPIRQALLSRGFPEKVVNRALNRLQIAQQRYGVKQRASYALVVASEEMIDYHYELKIQTEIDSQEPSEGTYCTHAVSPDRCSICRGANPHPMNNVGGSHG